MPTPLDNRPQYPEYLEPTISLFWDIVLYKPDYSSFLPLSTIESYIRLFDVEIHPFIIQVICMLDRVYTNHINITIQERTSKDT